MAARFRCITAKSGAVMGCFILGARRVRLIITRSGCGFMTGKDCPARAVKRRFGASFRRLGARFTVRAVSGGEWPQTKSGLKALSKLFRNVPWLTHERMSPGLVVVGSWVCPTGVPHLQPRCLPLGLFSIPKLLSRSHAQPSPGMIRPRCLQCLFRFEFPHLLGWRLLPHGSFRESSP